MSEDNSQNSNAADSGSPEDLKKELEKSKSDYLYLFADFDNFRKKTIKERSDLLKYGGERLVVSLLEVLDNFDRALQSAETVDKPALVEGIRLIHKDFKDILGRFGVAEINPLGQPFDPAQQEALSSQETTEVPEGHVCGVSKSAYKLHDRLIRPAQVVVAKKPKA